MKFLIVDDDLDFRKLTIHHLQKEFPDAKFQELSEQKEFTDAIRQWDFDAVITDLDNPGINGLDVCKQIREHDPYVPVIMLTASGNEELAVEGMKSGLNDYVTKSHLLRLPVSIREGMENARIRREFDMANHLLKASEERFRAFMNNSPTLSFIKDADGRYIYVNDPFKHFFDTKLNHICGKTDFDLMPPEIARQLHDNDMLALSANKTTESDETILAANGTPHYWWVFRFPLKDASGVRSLGVVAIDVTDRKLATMRQATQFVLTDIFAESGSFHAAAHKILKSICEGFGWELGEFWCLDSDSQLLRFETLWHVPSLDIFEFEGLSRTFTFSSGIGMPGRVFASGQPLWIRDVIEDDNFPRSPLAAKLGLHGAIAFPIFRKGAVLGVMGFFSRKALQPDNNIIHNMIDIGKRINNFVDRKLADELLCASEQKYRVLLENLPQRIFHKDKNSVYVSCNENYARDLKIRPDEIAGKTDYDFFPKNLAERYRADDKRVMESGKTEEIEENYAPDKQEFIIQTVKTPVKNKKGDVIGILGIFWDITDRKRMEQEKEILREQLYQSQKIESVGRLAGGIAHDINNILMAIIGYGNLLYDGMKENEPARDFVERILKSSEKAAKLIKGLLTFSRKQPYNPEPANLNAILQGVVDTLSRVIREDIRISTVLADEDCVIMADRIQIEQVITNLVTNARDAMPDGGFLIISTESMEIDDAFINAHGYGVKGGYALITVSDTGMGMDKQTQERIFEPFFTTKEVGKGTGLGLAIVYGIVKQHNGYITVHSAPGKGATFRIYLPLIQPKAEKAILEISPASKGGTETILLAEDNSEVRNVLKIALEGHGYKVITAVDGEDAINKFNKYKENIRILVFDVIMPGKNGKEAYNAIKQITPDMKSLFMSGYSEDIIQDRDIRREKLHFISKPVSPRDLLGKIREILDQ